jgi:regulatory protein YycI of two-component signal transduction system YycFG
MRVKILLLFVLILLALLFIERKEPSQYQNSFIRDSLQNELELQRCEYELKLKERDTVRITLYETITKWKDKPVETEADRCDSCCEVGEQYKIAYEACENALSACDTLQNTQQVVIEYDSTALILAYEQIEIEQKNVKKQKRRGNIKGIIGFVVGFSLKLL